MRFARLCVLAVTSFAGGAFAQAAPPTAPAAPSGVLAAPPAAATPTPTPPPLASSDASEPEGELAWFNPPGPYALPPPPPPPTPHGLLSAFYRTYNLSGPVNGFVPHVGVAYGGRVAAVMAGWLPADGQFSLGMMLPRFTGVRLFKTPSGIELGFLGPTFDLQLFTDLSDNASLAIGGSTVGLGLSTCALWQGGPSVFAQLRAPTFHLWWPIVVNGESDTHKTHASPMLAIGGGLEAGIVFF